MEGRKFLDFLDMIDGGGAGQMGDKFEGGGLLSALANLGGSPYGSEDEKRRAAREAFYSSQNIGGAPMTSPPPPQVIPNAPAAQPAQSPMQMFGGQPPAAYTPPPPTTAQRVGNMPPAAYSPTPGPSINPANVYGPTFTFEDFVAGLGPVAQTASPEDLMTAYRQHMMGY